MRNSEAAPGAPESPRVTFVRRAQAAHRDRSVGGAPDHRLEEQPATDRPATTATTPTSTAVSLPGPTAAPAQGSGSTPPPSSTLPALPTLDVGQASAILARLGAGGPGSHVVAMTLNPPGLGSVLARVQVSNSQLVVVLTPKDPAVAQALASNLADLGHQLGLTAGHRSLTLRLVDPEAGRREHGGSGPHERPGGGQRGPGREGLFELAPDPGTEVPIPTTLDLRL
jgi:hypothetical protein